MARYLDINVLQIPFDTGLDSAGRATYGFNILTMKADAGPGVDTFAEEIASLLGLVAGSTLFAGSKSTLPSDPSASFVSIIETVGIDGVRIHNQLRPAYPRPAARLVAHAPTTTGARALACAAYDALAGVRNATVTP